MRSGPQGVGVYLDNDSLIEIAKGSESRRQSFVQALVTKGALLFSFTNAIEVAGPQGRSADAVRALLDSIGAHWIPIEMNPYNVNRFIMSRTDGGPSPSCGLNW